MTRTYRIRECHPEDGPAVLDLWRQAEALPSRTDTLEELQRLVADHGGLFLVAEEEERLVGTIIGGWDGWRGAMYRLGGLPPLPPRALAPSPAAGAEARPRGGGCGWGGGGRKNVPRPLRFRPSPHSL